MKDMYGVYRALGGHTDTNPSFWALPNTNPLISSYVVALDNTASHVARV